MTIPLTPEEHIEACIEVLHKSGYTHDLKTFKDILLAKHTSMVQLEESIHYFENLSKRPDDHRLLSIAMLILNQTHQIWKLEEQSLLFFAELYEKNPDVFRSLMEKLSILSDKTNELFLKAHHLDSVIASLKMQMNLPSDALRSMDTFFHDTGMSYKSELQGLRRTHGPELGISTATDRLFLHHDIPHAMEIKQRTMHVACKKLRLLSEETPSTAFLKNVISFMIEFHDHEQVEPRPFATVEEITADRILAWLTESLDLDSKPPHLKSLLTYIADRIIVLGTTMVFSPKQTMDLSQLYFILENAAKDAGFRVADESNQSLIRLINAFMLITGICDKNPSAIREIISMQLEDETARAPTLPLLHPYLQGSSLIEQFCSDLSRFTHYDEASSPEVNQQIFLMALAPHLGMRAELSVKDKFEAVRSLKEFVVACRSKRLSLSVEDFQAWYNREFTRLDMGRTIYNLFFTAIESEAKFSLSQIRGLHFAYDRLISMEIVSAPTRGETPFIDESIPETDAKNLRYLAAFFECLAPEEQLVLLREILLTIVVQAGAIYAQLPSLRYETESTATFRRGVSFFQRPLSGDTEPLSGYTETDELERRGAMCTNPSHFGRDDRDHEPIPLTKN